MRFSKNRELPKNALQRNGEQREENEDMLKSEWTTVGNTSGSGACVHHSRLCHRGRGLCSQQQIKGLWIHLLSHPMLSKGSSQQVDQLDSANSGLQSVRLLSGLALSWGILAVLHPRQGGLYLPQSRGGGCSHNGDTLLDGG